MMADRAGDAGSAAGHHTSHRHCRPRFTTLFAAELGKPVNELPEGLGGVPVNHLVKGCWTLGIRQASHPGPNPALKRRTLTFQGDQLTVVVGSYRDLRTGETPSALNAEPSRKLWQPSNRRPRARTGHMNSPSAQEKAHPTTETVHDVPEKTFQCNPRPIASCGGARPKHSVARRASLLTLHTARDRLRSRRWRKPPRRRMLSPQTDGTWGTGHSRIHRLHATSASTTALGHGETSSDR